MEQLWTMERWKKVPSINNKNRRHGLRLRIDRDVDPVVRRACKDFAQWLRSEYAFPVRVRVYVKSFYRIKAKDGDLVCGTCWKPDDRAEEPYIRIAAGDYRELCEKIGELNAQLEILCCMAHELSHYYQWLNDLPLTMLGEERQAKRYSLLIVDKYLAQTSREESLTCANG